MSQLMSAKYSKRKRWEEEGHPADSFKTEVEEKREACDMVLNVKTEMGENPDLSDHGDKTGSRRFFSCRSHGTLFD